MTVRDALARGELREAIGLAGASVRDHPLDTAARFTLIDLLGFAGDWSRAGKQLDALGNAPGVEVYRSLVGASRHRDEFFAQGGAPPSWLIEPPAWADRHRGAIDHLRSGNDEAARADFGAVEAAIPPLFGTLAGDEFAGIRDLDDRLGPVLELILPGGYYWVAWEDVRFLDVAPPASVRDLLWAPARVALAQGPIGWAHLPTLYPGSAAIPGAVALGRATDWREVGSDLALGLGLKLALAGERSLTLFELRDIQFHPPTPESPTEPA